MAGTDGRLKEVVGTVGSRPGKIEKTAPAVVAVIGGVPADRVKVSVAVAGVVFDDREHIVELAASD